VKTLVAAAASEGERSFVTLGEGAALVTLVAFVAFVAFVALADCNSSLRWHPAGAAKRRRREERQASRCGSHRLA